MGWEGWKGEEGRQSTGTPRPWHAVAGRRGFQQQQAQQTFSRHTGPPSSWLACLQPRLLIPHPDNRSCNRRSAGGKLVSVKDIVMEHWKQFGRNFYSRYDYEGVESEKADAMIKHLETVIASAKKGGPGVHGWG